MSIKKVAGKLRKRLNRTCPDCEEHILELREIKDELVTVCPSCGFEEKTDGHDKSSRILREIKHGKQLIKK